MNDIKLRFHLPVALLIIIFFGLLSPALSFPNGPDNFRGIKWGTDIKDVKNMIVIENAGDTKFYIRKDDKNKIGEAVVDKIIYAFYKGKFYVVFIEFKSITNFVSLKETFFQQYGPGLKTNRFLEDYDWGLKGSDVHINFKYSKISGQGQIAYEYLPISKEQELERKQKAKEAKDDL